MEEFMRPAAMTIAFALLIWLGDRQKWIMFDAMLACGFGVMYIVMPASTMGVFVTGELDETAVILTRLFGAALIGSSLVWLLTRETLDGTVPITLIMSRVFSGSLAVLTQAYTYFGTSIGKKDITWNQQFVAYGIYGQFLWMATNLWFLVRSDDFSTYPQHNIRINTHLRFDAWMTMLLAVVYLAFPDFIMGFLPLKNPANCFHLHTCRNIGVLLFGSVIVSMQAPGFLHEKDKRSQFAARMSSHLLSFLMFVIMAMWYDSIPVHQLGKIFLASSPILINAAIGLFADGTVIYRVPKKAD